jgi:hypothetical protein
MRGGLSSCAGRRLSDLKSWRTRHEIISGGVLGGVVVSSHRHWLPLTLRLQTLNNNSHGFTTATVLSNVPFSTDAQPDENPLYSFDRHPNRAQLIKSFRISMSAGTRALLAPHTHIARANSWKLTATLRTSSCKALNQPKSGMTSIFLQLQSQLVIVLIMG